MVPGDAEEVAVPELKAQAEPGLQPWNRGQCAACRHGIRVGNTAKVLAEHVPKYLRMLE